MRFPLTRGILAEPAPMLLRISWAITAGLLSLGFVDLAGACSLERFPDIRDPEATVLLATATTDTVRAGAGGRTYYPDDARIHDPVDAPERPIHGQVVSLERIGGRHADAVRGMADRFGGEVVVVPWGYRADCRTTAWSASARWIEPGARGMYIVRLRDPEDWVDGRPTFDTGGWHEPYPHAGGLRLSDVPADSVLTPDQFFSLYATLPTREALERDPEAAAEPLLAWMAANPELASRVPARNILESARSTVEFARVARIVPPMRGTYRVVVTPESGRSRELFIRTAARASGPARDISGYTLHIHAAYLPGEIAEGHEEARQHPCDHGSIRVAEHPETSETGPTRWAAAIDWSMIARCFPESAEIARAVKVHADRIRSGEGEPVRGVFHRHPDGEMVLEQSLRADGRVILRIEGRRISEETLP